jgi:hypothetical protein
MQTPDDLDPYRAPRSETTQAEGTLAGAGQPLPWEPLDSFQFAFKQLRAYPMAILIAFVAILCSSVLGMMGAVAQALLNASGEREKILLGWVVYTLAIVVNTPIAAWMAVGQARCALAMLRGRRPEISEVFGTKGALSGIGAQLLYSLVSILIGGLCLGPGLVVLFQDDASHVRIPHATPDRRILLPQGQRRADPREHRRGPARGARGAARGRRALQGRARLHRARARARVLGERVLKGVEASQQFIHACHEELVEP